MASWRNFFRETLCQDVGYFIDTLIFVTVKRDHSNVEGNAENAVQQWYQYVTNTIWRNITGFDNVPIIIVQLQFEGNQNTESWMNSIKGEW